MSQPIPLRRPAEITTEIARLAPADARRLLERNTHNRKLNDTHILKLATAMEQGLWRLNGEPIIIGASGTILNGQHRLTALSMQGDGTQIEFVITRGIDDDAQSTMDQGRIRSLADIMTLDGIESNKSLAAALRSYLLWTRDLLFVDRAASAAQLSNQFILGWAQENLDTTELLKRGLAFRKVPTRPALTAAVYARVAEIHDVDVADEFFQRAADGQNLADGSPILALRSRLYRMRGENRDNLRTRLSDRDILGLIITAFNAWVADRPMAKLQRPTGNGYTKQRFPQIASPLAAEKRAK